MGKGKGNSGSKFIQKTAKKGSSKPKVNFNKLRTQQRR